MSAIIEYKITKGIFPVKVIVTDTDVDPVYVWPIVQHDNPGIYEYTGLTENTNYSITFSGGTCSVIYKNLKKVTS